MLGGHSAPKPADPEAQGVADSVRAAVEQQSGKNFGMFQLHSYTSQVVAGTNFKLKVQVDNNEFLHLQVFRPLPHTGSPPQLNSCQGGKTLEDAL